MDIPRYSIFQKPDPASYFKRDGLDANALAKLDKQVKSAQDTLAMADSLENIRNTLRETTRYDLNRKPYSLGLRYSVTDIKI